MNIFDKIGIGTDYVVIGLMAFSLLLLILVITLFVKNSKLNKKYRAFMAGKDAKSLEETLKDRFDEVNTIKSVLEKHNDHLEVLDENLKKSYQKTSIIKYDAFKEMGGNLSFAVALLNEENSGFILNCMHSTREGCYTYIKEIIHGESYVVLAEEEQQALDEAIKSNELIK